jgi:hypothetical protein
MIRQTPFRLASARPFHLSSPFSVTSPKLGVILRPLRIHESSFITVLCAKKSSRALSSQTRTETLYVVVVKE